MKKLFLVLAVAGISFGFSSCKKDWNCVCDGNVVGTYSNVKKGDAEDACNALETAGSFIGGYTSCDVEKN